MTDLNLDQRLLISDEAKRLLGDPLFNGVLNAITKSYISDLMKHQPGSTEGMVAHAGLRALDDIKGQLRALENDGAMARKQMKSE